MSKKARKQRITTSEHVDPTRPASIVVNKFGGLTRFCEKTGYAISTVHNWMVNGLIPANRFEFIMTVATQYGIKIRATDFVPAPATAQAAAE